MSDQDIWWKQRFQNFQKAFDKLSGAVSKIDLSDLEKAGYIQYFELAFELSWKTINDYLNFQNVNVKYPRDTIKEAFTYNLIDDGDLWMEMLDKRNIMSDTYDETSVDLAYSLIYIRFYSALRAVYQKLNSLQ